jgi:hypothetical protein
MTSDPFEGAEYVDDEDSPFEAAGQVDPVTSLVVESGGTRRMPHPLTGKPKRFTRMSKFAGRHADEYVLTEWKLAFAVMGTAKNRGLYAEANSLPIPTEDMEFRPKGWWRPWAEIAHQAMDFADASYGARLGTAVHRWSEQVELDTLQLKSVPPEWRKHVEALIRLRAQHGMVLIPEMRERLIVNLGLHNGLSGKWDALVLGPDGRIILDDTKTGKNVPDFGLGEIGVQLSGYSRAEYLWEPDNSEATHGYVPTPEIRTDVATLTWLPINRPEDSELVPVDLEEGWLEAERIVKSIQYQNRSRRKNNGLRLPIESLYSAPEIENIFDGARAIHGATSVAELHVVVTQMFSDGKLTEGLSLMAETRAQQIEEES